MDVSTANGAASPELTPDAPAVAHPSSADSASAPSAANGEATPPAESLQERQKRQRREREAAKRKAVEDRAAKRAARKVAKGAEPAAAETKPAEEVAEDDDRDDAQRARETGGFWKLTLRIVSLCLLPFGYRLDALTKDEVAEDVALLAPLAKRHRWLDVLVRYAALPYLLADRIATKVRKREPAKPAPAQKGGAS